MRVWQNPVLKPTNAVEERKSRIWNCWARTSRLPGGDGVITHVFEEDTQRAREGRAICGAPVYDAGGLNMLHDDYRPGCFRCQKLLKGWGLLPHDE